MPRIPLVEPETAPPDVRALFDEIQSSGLPILNVMKMFANHAALLGFLVQGVKAVYTAPHLAPRYRELAYLRASQLNSCHY